MNRAGRIRAPMPPAVLARRRFLDIEPGIRPAVRLLVRRGADVVWSCAGHRNGRSFARGRGWWTPMMRRLARGGRLPHVIVGLGYRRQWRYRLAVAGLVLLGCRGPVRMGLFWFRGGKRESQFRAAAPGNTMWGLFVFSSRRAALPAN